MLNKVSALLLFCVVIFTGCYSPEYLDVSANNAYSDMREKTYILLKTMALQQRVNNSDPRDGFHAYYKVVEANNSSTIFIPAGQRLEFVSIIFYYLKDERTVCYMTTELDGNKVLLNVNELTTTNGDPTLRVEFNPALLRQEDK